MATGNKDKITDWVNPNDKSGEFKRQQSAFRNFISREPGAQFPPEKGRYHLYVSYACPWAHRTLITRKLKGLEDIISFSSVHWHLAENGTPTRPPDPQLNSIIDFIQDGASPPPTRNSQEKIPSRTLCTLTSPTCATSTSPMTQNTQAALQSQCSSTKNKT
jgi:glutathionyl-hydroquinone reductase